MQELIELIVNNKIRLDIIEKNQQMWLEKEKEQMLNFYMWMRMNENTEKYLDYSDEDMFKEYLNQDI